MNPSTLKRSARRYVVYLAIVFVTACGGGGGGGGDPTPPPPPPPPMPDPVTFEAELISITITDMATGDPVSVDGLPLGSAEITVTP